MPVSSSVQISDCLDHIIRLSPRSVLDIGCGFGLWGFLCREYLDVWNGRIAPDSWQVRIEGVELWEPYIQPHQLALYSAIHIGDVREVLPRLGEYELIIAGDVIEHLDKPDGEHVIEQLYDHATRALLVNIPLAGNWDHPENYGNPGELHRSQWSPDDFVQYAPKFRDYQLPCGQYGSFYCEKSIDPEKRLAGLLYTGIEREKRGDLTGAARALARAQRLAPTDTSTALHLADLQLRLGDRQAAAECLRVCLLAEPTFHFGRLQLSRLLLSMGLGQEASQHLQALMNTDGLSEEIESQLQPLLAQISSR